MRYLSLSDVFYINRVVIKKYGGRFEEPNNLNNVGSLEWALDVIQNPFFFGVNQYPTINHKVAVLAWSINDGHVFKDGNKRTSSLAALIFLTQNGFDLNAKNDEIVEISLSIADRENSGIEMEDLIDWYSQRIIIA